MIPLSPAELISRTPEIWEATILYSLTELQDRHSYNVPIIGTRLKLLASEDFDMKLATIEKRLKRDTAKKGTSKGVLQEL